MTPRTTRGRWVGGVGAPARWGLAVLLVLALTGCGSEEQEDDVSSDDPRAVVEERLREVAHALREQGWDLPEARGRWTTCGMGSTGGLQYSAGGQVDRGEESGGPAEVVRQVQEAMVGLGWELRATKQEPRPYATLDRGELYATVAEEAQGRGTVSVAVRGPCVTEGEGADPALLSERPSVDLG